MWWWWWWCGDRKYEYYDDDDDHHDDDDDIQMRFKIVTEKTSHIVLRVVLTSH